MQQKILNNLPPEIKNTVLQLHDTILKRSLMQAYKNLDNDKKAMMAEIFNSNDDEQKSDFLHNYLGDLQDIIIKETKKITEEIKQRTH